MSILMSLSEFQFLTKDNYSNWKSFIQKFLCGCGHQLWDVVTGSYNRADAQDKQKFDVIDRVALDTIRRAIDKEVHSWVSGKFTSSKELWDYIELKFQRQEQKKMKKRAKQKQRKLKQRESADFLFLPVPNLADDSKNSFGCFGDLLPDIGNGTLLEKSNVLSVFEGYTHMQQEQDHSSCITQLELPQLMIDSDCFLIKEVLNDVTAYQDADTDWQKYECDDEETIQQLEQLEVPVFDVFLDTHLPSVAQRVLSEYAETELVLECVSESSLPSQSISFHLDLQHEVIESKCFLDNNRMTDLFSGEEQHAGHTQEFMAAQEEIVSEFPWLEIDSKTCDFQSVLSQVSEQVLPLYINLHIPFSCPHDGKVKDHNLDDYLGFIVHADVEGVVKQLQVLASQNVEEFSETNTWSYAYYDISVLNEVSVQQEQFYMEHFSTAATRGQAGSHVLIAAREWYRGRKMWSKIKNQDQSWLLLWLSLLYFTSTA